MEHTCPWAPAVGRTAGVGEEVVARLAESRRGLRLSRVAGRDTYVPLAGAAHDVLVAEDDIETAVVSALDEGATR